MGFTILTIFKRIVEVGNGSFIQNCEVNTSKNSQNVIQRNHMQVYHSQNVVSTIFWIKWWQYLTTNLLGIWG